MFLSEVHNAKKTKCPVCWYFGCGSLSWHCTFWFHGLIYGAAVTSCCSVVWTVGRLWNQMSNDGERPIKFLHHGHSPGYKRPTQGLYLCSAVDLEREMPASPCSLAHRGGSVSDKYATMMPNTVSPTADFSIQTLLVFLHFSRLLMHESVWVCLSIQSISLEWKNIDEGCGVGECCRAGDLHCRGMLLITHEHPLTEGFGAWFVCVRCFCLKEAELPWSQLWLY